jgi:riboflavin kinase, archaea type
MTGRTKGHRMRSEELRLLRFLAHGGAQRTPVEITSREVGEHLEVSQQAADRYLVDLAKQGLISRSLGARKQRLTLTPAGVEVLRKEFHAYRRVFEGPSRLRFSGQVASGLGEGRYYLSQPGYILQFQERLGYTPYPGTLNIRVDPKELLRIDGLRDWDGVRIDGFQASGRTFGGATCYGGRINGRPCHLIRPDRSHYQDVVELIAPESLRESLSVHDGDSVAVEVEEP